MKTLKLIKILFAVIGALLLALAAYQAQSTQRFLLQANQTAGTVIDLTPVRSDNGTTYRPLVAYRDASGQARTMAPSSSSNPPSHDVGEEVTVLVSGTGDGEVRLQGFMPLWGGAVISGALGGVFALVGLGMQAYHWRQRRSAAFLLQQGQPVEALIQGVEYNEAISVNGRNPFVVLCQWQNPQTQEIHVFQSENLWFDPSGHLKREQVRVYIEPNNPKRYLVDLSFLPKMAA